MSGNGSEGQRAHIIVHGVVQGVFYRANARDRARDLGLSGWVRNLPDGGVEAVFEGPPEAVLEMVRWCCRGPEYCRVDHLEAEFSGKKGEFSCFEIRR